MSNKLILVFILFANCELMNSQNWTYYTILNTSIEQGSNNITDIEVDSKGSTWMINKFGGISEYDGNKFYNYTKSKGLDQESVIDIAIDDQNKVYVLGYTMINILFNNQFTYLALPALHTYNNIILDHKGTVFIADNNSIFEFSNNIWKEYNIGQYYNLGYNLEIYNLDVDHLNSIWMATNSGLIKLENGRLSRYTSNDGMVSNQIICVKANIDNMIYFSYKYSGFGILQNSIVTNFSKNNNITDYYGKQFVINKDSSITYLHKIYGLVKYNLFDGQITIIPNDFVKNHSNGSIAINSNDEIWVGTNKGLSKYNTLNIEYYSKSTGLTSNAINTIYFDQDHKTYVGTDDGICKFENNKWSILYSGYRIADVIDYKNNEIFCNLVDSGASILTTQPTNQLTNLNYTKPTHSYKNVVDNQGTYWLPTTVHTVMKSENNKVEEIELVPYDKNNRLKSIALNPVDNKCYLATYNGVFKYENKEFKQIAKTKSFICFDIAFTSTGTMILFMQENKFLPLKLYMYDANGLQAISDWEVDRNSLYMGNYLFVDSKDNIWFGYQDGLYYGSQQNWKLFTETNGLLSNIVNCIDEDAFGSIWIGTHSGISVLNQFNVTSQVDLEVDQNLIYPNPCTEIIKFNIRDNHYKNADLLIVNNFGQAIHHAKINDNSIISTADWTPGIYFYQIKGRDNIISKGKFLKY